MRVLFGHCRVTWGPLCRNFGYIKVLLKNCQFPIHFNDFISSSGHFGIDLGVNLGSFLAYGGTLEPYLSKFDVEKHEVASVMGICASLVGPKSENVEKVRVF